MTDRKTALAVTGASGVTARLADPDASSVRSLAARSSAPLFLSRLIDVARLLRPARPSGAQLIGAFLFALITTVSVTGNLAACALADGAPSVWFANGIVGAVMLRRPPSKCPLLLAGAFAGFFASLAIVLPTVGGALTTSLLNIVEVGIFVVACAWRFRPDGHFAGAPIRRVAMAALAAPLLPAALMLAAKGGDGRAWSAALAWLLGHSAGLAIAGPLILAVSGPGEGSLLPKGKSLVAALAGALAFTFAFFDRTGIGLILLLPVTVVVCFSLPLNSSLIGLGAAMGMKLSVADRLWPRPAESWAFGLGEAHEVVAVGATIAVIILVVRSLIDERNRLSAAYLHSERLFHRVAEATPAGILHIDLGGRVTFGNDRWVALTSSRPLRFDDEAWLEQVLPDDRAAARGLWARARTLHQPVSDDLRFIQPDGGFRWAELSLYPELAGGLVLGFVARLYDVNRRHEVERALHDSEQLYRLLAENSHDLIVRLGADSKITYASNAARGLLALDPADLVGHALSSFVHPADRAAFDTLMPQANGGCGDATAQFRVRRANSSYHWVEASARVVHDSPGSDVPELVASIRDIDARRQSEESALASAARLRESNRLLTLAEGLAEVGHWHLDALTGEFTASPQVSRISGLAATAPFGPTNLVALIHPEARGALFRTLVRARRQRAPTHCSTRLLVDGQVRHLRLVLHAEHDDRGRLLGLFGVMRDVTRDERVQAELTDARDEARAAAQAKSDFLATMSHEIRTPMTGVLGMIDLLRSVDSDEEERIRYLATLKQSADLLLAVLDDILDFSRIESGKIVFEERDFDLDDLLQSTVDLFDGAASAKRISLSFDAARPARPIVRGDPVRLQQVVSNLLSNAIKFTNEGAVCLSLALVTTSPDRQGWRIKVRDSGIGMEPDTLATLFDPFVQADAATSRRYGGTGLGLAICRRLVEGMGGLIGVDSMPGSGSVFWFEIDLPVGKFVPLGMDAREEAPSARALDVLVAEDNPVNQLLIAALLRRLGHRCTTVANGRQAVDLAGERGFDCVLMDMQMPEMDGLAATRAIRASSGPCARIPIVALTADASSERRRFYDGAGLTAFLTKPINRGQLARQLAVVAAAPRASEEPPERAIAAEPQGTDATAFDLERYQELRDVLGQQRVGDLLDLLKAEIDRSPARIRALISSGDLDGARAEAHGLKGAASNIGAVGLGRAAATIETAEGQGTLDKALDSLDEQSRRTLTAIAALG